MKRAGVDFGFLNEILDMPLPVGKEGTRPQKVSAVDGYGHVSPMFDGGK